MPLDRGRSKHAKKIIGYDGPRGGWVATRDGFKPLTDPNALLALTDSALLTSLGSTDKAAEYQRIIDRRRGNA